MEHHNTSGESLIAVMNMAISIVSAIFAWVTLKDLQLVISMFASGIAIVSGIFAIRYYITATGKVKNEHKIKYKK
jgi:hypothetical protein